MLFILTLANIFFQRKCGLGFNTHWTDAGLVRYYERTLSDSSRLAKSSGGLILHSEIWIHVRFRFVKLNQVQ